MNGCFGYYYHQGLICSDCEVKKECYQNKVNRLVQGFVLLPSDPSEFKKLVSLNMEVKGFLEKVKQQKPGKSLFWFLEDEL